MKNDELITLPLKKYEKIKEAAEKGFKRVFLVKKTIVHTNKTFFVGANRIVPNESIEISYETYSEADLFKKLETENKNLHLEIEKINIEKGKEIIELITENQKIQRERQMEKNALRNLENEITRLKLMPVRSFKKWREM